MDPLSLYLHIPFCTVKCPYCDFNTYSRMESLIPEYLDALKNEIHVWGSEIGDSYETNTIYFGGGTPSLLMPVQVHSVLETCKRWFRVAEDVEISLEANPENVTPEYMSALLQAGVNRLSMGVQSFDDDELKWLGRTHDSEAIVRAYYAARQAGFGNISLDLIYGLTDQSMATWEDTLGEAIGLKPEHVSLYALTIEQDTPFGKKAARGLLQHPNPDVAADMYLLAADMLSDNGYNHYEISNWELGGHACRHNTTYWEDRCYVGFGPGAHSYFGGFRFSDIRSPKRYIESMDRLAKHHSSGDASRKAFTEEAIHGLSPVDMIEHIDKTTEMVETMVLGLRLIRGASKKIFRARFGMNIDDVYPGIIAELKELGLLEEADEYIRLTPEGWLLSNEAFVRFL